MIVCESRQIIDILIYDDVEIRGLIVRGHIAGAECLGHDEESCSQQERAICSLVYY